MGVQLPANSWQKLRLLIKRNYDEFLPCRKASLNKSFVASLFFLSSLHNSQPRKRKKSSPYLLEEKKEEEVRKRVQERSLSTGTHFMWQDSSPCNIWHQYRLAVLASTVLCWNAAMSQLHTFSAIKTISFEFTWPWKKILQRMCKVGELLLRKRTAYYTWGTDSELIKTVIKHIYASSRKC